MVCGNFQDGLACNLKRYISLTKNICFFFPKEFFFVLSAAASMGLVEGTSKAAR